jgi:hypothetical protein
MMGWGTIYLHQMMHQRKRIWTLIVLSQSIYNILDPYNSRECKIKRQMIASVIKEEYPISRV